MALIVIRTEVAVRHILTESVMAETIAPDKIHPSSRPLAQSLCPLLIADIAVGVMPSCCPQVDLPVVGSPNAKRLPTLRGQFMLGSFGVLHNRNSRESTTGKDVGG